MDIDKLKEVLNELADVVEIIEKRTVEKPSDNYILTPVKRKIMELKNEIRRL